MKGEIALKFKVNVMKKIEFFKSRENTFRKVSEFAPPAFLEKLSESDRETEVKTHFSGENGCLALMELQEIPNAEAVLHYHDKEEIFFVLDGEMHFGNRIFRAGDSIRIDAGVQYKFRTGPNGLRYLKFTATADHSVNVVPT